MRQRSAKLFESNIGEKTTRALLVIITFSGLPVFGLRLSIVFLKALGVVNIAIHFFWLKVTSVTTDICVQT